jgi:MFS family permease
MLVSFGDMMNHPALLPSFGRASVILVTLGAVILAISLGIRHSFGLFLQPMSVDNGWGREVFAFAIALQNIIWGVSQPFTGMLADRYGAARIIAVCGVLYGLGLMMMAFSTTSLSLSLSLGVLIGLGLSGTSFSVVFGAVVQSVAPKNRSKAMGIASAVGSFGQFAMLPGAMGLIQSMGWIHALLCLAVLASVLIVLGAMMRTPPKQAIQEAHVSVRQALREAGTHKGFWLLCFGFFVCGFQVVFIATHLPSYVLDKNLPAHVGTTTLALVGLFNIFGTYYAGLWGGVYRKSSLLALIYALRAVAIALFVFLPLSSTTAYVFGAVLGLLWLSTVPLTNGIVASIFGIQNMAMLSGIVYFFHQVGAFLGSWLGGALYDKFGSYDKVWMIAIGLSLIAAVANLPIREAPLVRTSNVKAA